MTKNRVRNFFRGYAYSEEPKGITSGTSSEGGGDGGGSDVHCSKVNGSYVF